ncbi:unnamed protein product [Lathyrus oleraceus]
MLRGRKHQLKTNLIKSHKRQNRTLFFTPQKPTHNTSSNSIQLNGYFIFHFSLSLSNNNNTFILVGQGAFIFQRV